MEDNKKLDKKNIEINVFELVKYICKKAIWILVISLVIAGIVSIAKYVSDKNEYGSTQSNSNDSYESQKYESNLQHINFYEKAYESRKEYERESILMSLDSYNINVASIDFFIDAKEENIIDVMTAFSTYGNEGGLITDMYKKDSQIKEKYLYEIVSVSCSNYENYGTSSVMNIRVYGKTTEQCKHFVDIIKTVLNEYSARLNNIGIENNIKQCDESYFVDKDGNVFQIQKNFIDSLTEIENEITRLKEENSVYAAQGILPSGQIGTDKTEETVSFNIKYFILGLAIGLVLAVCVYAFKFILSGRVKYATELSEVRDIDYIGSIDKVKKNSAELEQLPCKIKWTCEYHDTSNISVVGNFLKATNDVEEFFKTNIKKLDINSKIVGDVVNDIDSMNKLMAGDNVIVVVLENETSYNYVDSLMENCILKKVNIMGYIYFRS